MAATYHTLPLRRAMTVYSPSLPSMATVSSNVVGICEMKSVVGCSFIYREGESASICSGASNVVYMATWWARVPWLMGWSLLPKNCERTAFCMAPGV